MRTSRAVPWSDIPRGEQALDHGVVEVAGDALAVVQERHLLHLGVEAGVLDRHPGRRGQPHHELLVLGA